MKALRQAMNKMTNSKAQLTQYKVIVLRVNFQNDSETKWDIEKILCLHTLLESVSHCSSTSLLLLIISTFALAFAV